MVDDVVTFPGRMYAFVNYRTTGEPGGMGVGWEGVGGGGYRVSGLSPVSCPRQLLHPTTGEGPREALWRQQLPDGPDLPPLPPGGLGGPTWHSVPPPPPPFPPFLPFLPTSAQEATPAFEALRPTFSHGTPFLPLLLAPVEEAILAFDALQDQGLPELSGERRLLLKYRPAKKAAAHLRALGLVDSEGEPLEDG